jgi:hypothetical protein
MGQISCWEKGSGGLSPLFGNSPEIDLPSPRLTSGATEEVSGEKVTRG